MIIKLAMYSAPLVKQNDHFRCSGLQAILRIHLSSLLVDSRIWCIWPVIIFSSPLNHLLTWQICLVTSSGHPDPETGHHWHTPIMMSPCAVLLGPELSGAEAARRWGGAALPQPFHHRQPVPTRHQWEPVSPAGRPRTSWLVAAVCCWTVAISVSHTARTWMSIHHHCSWVYIVVFVELRHSPCYLLYSNSLVCRAVETKTHHNLWIGFFFDDFIVYSALCRLCWAAWVPWSSLLL